MLGIAQFVMRWWYKSNYLMLNTHYKSLNIYHRHKKCKTDLAVFSGDLSDHSALSNPDKIELVYMVDYIDGFSNVEPTLHPRDEAYLILVDIFSDMFLDSVCQYFIEYFCIYVHEGYCLDKRLPLLLIFSKNQLFVTLIL
ncbi:hypothetical protein H671_2g5547 [Cricetulus griseus]|nr:hypothetical protein H671_2g5547 [Cricetulus griseus]